MRNLLLSFIALLFTVSVPAFGQEVLPVYNYNFGECTLHTLCEANRMGNTEILIGASPEILKEYAPDGTFPNAVSAFLITSKGRNILIDTGFGRNLFDHLSSIGINPESVDMLLITHMHGDHTGGMLRNGAAAFPNAKLYLSSAEFDYWTSDAEMNRQPENRRGGFKQAREILNAYSDRTQLFEPKSIDDGGVPLFDGLRAIAAYGHTPGHTMYMVESGKEQLLIWGDLTHATAIQLAHPEIAVTYDVDPDAAIRSRQATLNYLNKNDMPVAGMHIPYPGIIKSIKNTK